MASRGKPANRPAKAKGLGFDLSKPIKHGLLLKQGALHRAFKQRLFVLYPGFLVYYEDQPKWRLDVTRGDTLQSRQGAVKLKNCTANVAKHAPKGCKYGIILHAPDPSNKRQSYLINATSKEDRDMWVEAIRQATPHSPRPVKKELPKDTPTKQELVDRPQYTQRQETVNVAAKLASEAASQPDVEDSVTSIDHELSEEPAMSVRRDTSTSAALSISSGDKDTTIDCVIQEETEPVISMDIALGPADDDNAVISIDIALGPAEDDNASEADVLDKPDMEELDSEGSVDMPVEETVSQITNSAGDIEVTTTIAVVCNTEAFEAEGNKRGEEAADSNTPVIQNGFSTEDKPHPLDDAPTTETLSTEVFIPAAEERHNSFTINSTDPDGDSDTDNEDGDGSSLASSVTDAPATPPTPSTPHTAPSTPHTTPSTPHTAPSTPAITLDRAISEEHKVEIKENGIHSESNGVESNGVRSNGVGSNGVESNGVVSNGVGSNGVESNGVGSNGVGSTSDGAKLSPPIARKNDGRRPSAAFIQKVGYLYKMGGQRKNWKLRYFVLNPGVFFYYKSPKSTKPLAEVKLKNSKVYFPTAGERKTSYQFAIHTESQWNKRPEWVIAAQSDREMTEWIDAFKAAGHKGTPSPSSSLAGSDED